MPRDRTPISTTKASGIKVLSHAVRATGGVGGTFGDVSTSDTTTTDNELVRMDGTGGKTIQGTPTNPPTVSDTGALSLGANPGTLDTVNIDGSFDLHHTAAVADDHAMEIEVDAAGFGDVKAIAVEYITGALATGQQEAVIFINLNEIDATGGHLHGMEMLATEGGSTLFGMKVGPLIGPVHQDSGVFVNPDTATDNTASSNVANMKDGNIGTTTDIFESVNEFIIIGKTSSAFQDIELVLTTDSSGAGIKPTFFYSTSGTAQFTQFTPIDGTNGCRTSGIISWDASDLTGHVADDVTGTFDIKIVRTRVSLTTSPVLGFAKVAAVTEFTWDKDGDLLVKDVTVGGSAGVKLSASNGTLTMLGLGDGFDENLTWDFNSTENTIILNSTSGADTLDLSGFTNLIGGTNNTFPSIFASDTSLDINGLDFGPGVGVGGFVTIAGGDGGETSGNAGGVTLLGGIATSGTAGSARLLGGGATSGTGGFASITGGNSSSGTGGAALVTGGQGIAGGPGGVVQITGGRAFGSGEDGGSVTIRGGQTSSGTTGSIIIASTSEDLVLDFTSNTLTASTTTGLDLIDLGSIGLSTSGTVTISGTIAGPLDIRGAGDTGGILVLTTSDTEVQTGDRLGQIDFQAPLEASGTDAILVAASIWAEATVTDFTDALNTTDLVFATAVSEVATEKMRLTSAGLLQIGSPTGVSLSATDGVLTLAGQKSAGNNENITIDFESNANKAIINSTSGVNRVHMIPDFVMLVAAKTRYRRDQTYIYSPAVDVLTIHNGVDFVDFIETTQNITVFNPDSLDMDFTVNSDQGAALHVRGSDGSVLINQAGQPIGDFKIHNDAVEVAFNVDYADGDIVLGTTGSASTVSIAHNASSLCGFYAATAVVQGDITGDISGAPPNITSVALVLDRLLVLLASDSGLGLFTDNVTR